jgi:hypothetical protein
LLEHFAESLQQVDVAEDHTREILALLESTRNAVLGR